VSDGFKFLISSTFILNFARLASNILLASWLAPEVFALTGITIAFVLAFEMFTDGGFKAYILRHKQGNEGDLLATVWTVRLIRGLFLGVALIAFSHLIANNFNIVNLATALQISSLIFFINAIEPISYLTAERNGNVAKVLKIEMVISLSVTLITVTLVYLTKSFWVIVWSSVLAALLRLILGFYVLGKKGSYINVNGRYLRELLHWAKFIIPSSIITLLISTFDKFFLGKVLSVQELGLYFIAFNLAGAAMSFVINYARRILEPFMANIYRVNPSEFKIILYKKKYKVCALLALCLGVGIGVGPIFFDLFYDQRYQKAAFYLGFLLITPIMGLVTYTSEVSLILHGQLKATLTMNIIRLLWLSIVCIGAFYLYGIFGVLTAFASIELLPMYYAVKKLHTLNLVIIKREISIPFIALLGAIIGYVIQFLYFHSKL
jgi:lipopolysaccharide exporter